MFARIIAIALIAVWVLCTPVSTLASITTIDFDDGTDESDYTTPADNRYSAKGVELSGYPGQNVYLFNWGQNTESPPNVLTTMEPGEIGPTDYFPVLTTDSGWQLNVTFTFPVKYISAFFGCAQELDNSNMVLSIPGQGISVSIPFDNDPCVNQFIELSSNVSFSSAIFQFEGEYINPPIVIDNLSFGDKVAIIPAPSAALLGSIGIGSIAWLRRRPTSLKLRRTGRTL
jgi:hypothetical protein